MQITYLANSGFALEEAGELLVFDCFNPEKHSVLAKDALAKKKAATVFVSHVHGDHYSPKIWQLPNVSFVVSFDVAVPPAYAKKAVVLHPGESARVNGLDIQAYGSTDEGISFHVRWGDLSIFHAGDFNDWHWRDEGGEAYAKTAEDAFLAELSNMRANELKLDYAFFPVDPRIGSDYYRGAVLFAEAMRPKYFIPMHFGKTFSPPPEFYADIAPYTELLAAPEQGLSIKITV